MQLLLVIQMLIAPIIMAHTNVNVILDIVEMDSLALVINNFNISSLIPSLMNLMNLMNMRSKALMLPYIWISYWHWLFITLINIFIYLHYTFLFINLRLDNKKYYLNILFEWSTPVLSYIEGYQLSLVSSQFTDINECTTGNHGCHSNATCINLPGTKNCTCNIGFSGNGTYCSGRWRFYCLIV